MSGSKRFFEIKHTGDSMLSCACLHRDIQEFDGLGNERLVPRATRVTAMKDSEVRRDKTLKIGNDHTGEIEGNKVEVKKRKRRKSEVDSDPERAK